MAKIKEIEDLMGKYDITIETHGELYLTYGKTEFKVGHQSTSFPRYTEEPIILIED